MAGRLYSQLCIRTILKVRFYYKQQTNLFLIVGKMLVKCPGLDVNLSTSKTTALHIAAKNGRLPLVQMLLQCKADIQYILLKSGDYNLFSLKNEDGMLPFEVTTNEEIRRALDFESMRQSDLVNPWSTQQILLCINSAGQ